MDNQEIEKIWNEFMETPIEKLDQEAQATMPILSSPVEVKKIDVPMLKRQNAMTKTGKLITKGVEIID